MAENIWSVTDMEVIFWLGLCCAVGYFADKKGRNAFGWGVCAFLLSPLLVGIALALAKDLRQEANIAQNSADQLQLRDRVEANEYNVGVRLQNVENKVDYLTRNANPDNFIAAHSPGILLPTGHSRAAGPDVAAFCSNCGHKVVQGQNFCTKCGRKIS
jgi:hypothetical protein